jgi:hypothetical protein
VSSSFYLLALPSIGVASWLIARLRAVRAVRSVAYRVGLDFKQSLRGARATGSVRRYGTRLDSVLAQIRYVTRIEVVTGSLSGLELERTGVKGAMRSVMLKLIGEGRLLTGDPDFDQRIIVRGPDELAAIARLTHDARTKVLVAVHHKGAKLANGRLRLLIQGRFVGGNELHQLVIAMGDLAHALDRPEATLRERMIENLKNDPVPEVRLKNLEMLAHADHKGAPEVKAALLGALKDAQPSLRVEAARALGQDGYETIAQVLFGTAESTESRVLAASAFTREMMKMAPHRERLELMVESVEEPLFSAVLRAIDAAQEVGLVELLAARIAFASSEAKRLIARIVARADDARVEDWLLSILAAEDDKTAAEAARSLELRGSLKSVEPLINRAKSLIADSDLKTAVAAAVTAIQSRHGGAPGELSIAADSAAGQVSVAAEPASAGELSVSPAQGGELGEPSKP